MKEANGQFLAHLFMFSDPFPAAPTMNQALLILSATVPEIESALDLP
jgi:hypothetical protein